MSRSENTAEGTAHLNKPSDGASLVKSGQMLLGTAVVGALRPISSFSVTEETSLLSTAFIQNFFSDKLGPSSSNFSPATSSLILCESPCFSGPQFPPL